MIVHALDGREIKWNFTKYYSRKQRTSKSSYHLLAEGVLQDLFPNSTLYEEVTLPTNPATYADFFVPDYRLVVEVHGEQHYKFNPRFHRNQANQIDKMEFYRGQARDKMKKEWCKFNDLAIAELPFNEKETWKQIIVNSIYQ